MAHFVEHMAFNGTQNFPEGAINNWLHRRGMRIGIHANAETSLNSTVYRIDLPTADLPELRQALTLLREFADRIMFDARAIESEMAVVDAEERESQWGDAALIAQARRLLLKGGREDPFGPLGAQAVRASFTPDSLRRFYHHWYRASNMAVVIVGYIADIDVVTMCHGTFGDMPQRQVVHRRSLGHPTLDCPGGAIEVRDRTDVEWLIQSLSTHTIIKTSAALRRQVQAEAAAQVGGWLLYAALERCGSPARNATTTYWQSAEDLHGICIRVQASTAEADQALADCLGEMSRLGGKQFTESLLGNIRQLALARLAREYDAFLHMRSEELASFIAKNAAEGSRPVDQQALSAVLAEAWKSLTATECAEIWRRLWGETPSIISIGAPRHVFDTQWAEEQLRRSCESNPGAPRWLPFPQGSTHLSAGDHGALPGNGAVKSQAHHDADKIDELEFENRIKLLVKVLPGADRVCAEVSIGHGGHLVQQVEPALSRLLREVAGRLSQVGPGAADTELANQTVITTRIEPRRIVVRGVSLPGNCDNLLRSLSEVCDYLESVHLVHDLREVLDAQAAEPDHSAMDPEDDFITRMVGSGVEHSDALEGSGGQQDRLDGLHDYLWRCSVTVAVVGPIGVERAVQSAAATFGSRARRMLEVPDKSPTGEMGRRVGVKEVRKSESADVGSVVVVIPLVSMDDRAAACVRLIQVVLEDRLNQELREESGLAYVCRVSVREYCAAQPMAAMTVRVRVAPGTEELVEAVIRNQLQAIRSGGLSADEMVWARRVVDLERRDRLATAQGWCSMLATCHLQRTGWSGIVDMIARAERTTVADVTETAARLLSAQHVCVLMLRQETGAR